MISLMKSPVGFVLKFIVPANLAQYFLMKLTLSKLTQNYIRNIKAIYNFAVYIVTGRTTATGR